MFMQIGHGMVKPQRFSTYFTGFVDTVLSKIVSIQDLFLQTRYFFRQIFFKIVWSHAKFAQLFGSTFLLLRPSKSMWLRLRSLRNLRITLLSQARLPHLYNLLIHNPRTIHAFNFKCLQVEISHAFLLIRIWRPSKHWCLICVTFNEFSKDHLDTS
jgi:hypothetical protein